MRAGALVLAAFTTVAGGQIVNPGPAERVCGPKLKPTDVLVVNLESFARADDGARFFREQVGADYDLGAQETIELRMPFMGLRVTENALESVQKIAAERGCNVVAVLGVTVRGTGNFIGTTSGQTTVSTEARRTYVTAMIGTASRAP